MGNRTSSTPSSPKTPSSPRSNNEERFRTVSNSSSTSSTSSLSQSQSPSKKDDRKAKKESGKAQKLFSKYLVAPTDDIPMETIELEKLIEEIKGLQSVVTKEEDKLWFQLILIWKLLGGGVVAQEAYQSEAMKEAGGMFPSSFFFDGLSKLSIHTPDELGEYLLSINREFKQFNRQDGSHRFKDFYRFCFTFGLQDARKTLSGDIAIYLWKSIISDRFPLITIWVAYLQKTSKAITRDTWNVFLDFVDLIRNSGGYDPDGAWPTVIDEFAEYCKAELCRDSLTGLCVQKVASLIHSGKLSRESNQMKNLPENTREMIEQYMKIVGWWKQ